jgi:hypothetical protein
MSKYHSPKPNRAPQFGPWNTLFLLLALLALPFAAPAAIADQTPDPSTCIQNSLPKILFGSAPRRGPSAADAAESTAPSPDLIAFQAGVPQVVGGVKPWSTLPIRNQCDAGFCWSYTLNETVDGQAQLKTGVQYITSADHNGFWHLYFQFFNHKQYFNELRKKVANGAISKLQARREALLMLSLRPGSTLARQAGFVVQSGSDETTALIEAATVGFIPDALFDHPVKTARQASALQSALNKLIDGLLSDTSQLSTYTTTAADGINDELYGLLSTNLKPFYGGSSTHLPYRPNDPFTITQADGTTATHTPQTYMKQVLQFDPTAYGEVTMTPQNQALLLQAVHDVLMDPTNPQAVPIGFPVYNQKLAQQQGVFAANTELPKPVGGHEVLLENTLLSPPTDPNPGSLVGLVAQNSWNTGTGLTIDGKPSAIASQTGYYGFTPQYLIDTISEPSSFMLPRSVLILPKYSGLQITTEAQRNRLLRNSE